VSGPIKVLHLISGLGIGGAEIMLLWTARFYDRGSSDIMIVSLISGGRVASMIRGEGVEVIELDQKRGRLSPAALIKLIKQARYFSPDIIQGHLFHSNLISRFLALLVPGARSVSTRHNEVDSLLRRFFYTITAPFSGGTIVFSEPVRSHSLKDSSLGGPVHLAPYGIDPQYSSIGRDVIRSGLELPHDAFVWIAVGRLTRQKGFDILISAFSDLCASTPGKPILLLVGDGEEKSILEKQASGMVQEGHISFLGQRHDMPDLLAASDAFVLSSRWEGGPLVLLEAMAAGLPVVATRVGDASNMVVEGKTGVLVQSGDVSGLTAAMTKIMKEAEGARLWGLKGKERMEANYSYRRTQKSMEQFYQELV